MTSNFSPEEMYTQEDPCSNCTSDCTRCSLNHEFEDFLKTYTEPDTPDNSPDSTIPLPEPESQPQSVPASTPAPKPLAVISKADFLVSAAGVAFTPSASLSEPQATPELPSTNQVELYNASTSPSKRGRPKNKIDPTKPVRKPGRLDDSLAAPGEAKRKPGGQPGNLNALKHGLYVQGNAIHNTTPMERAALFDYSKAIDHLKNYIDAAYENGKKLKTTFEINDTLKTLACAGLAITRMGNFQNQTAVSSLPMDLYKKDRTTTLQQIEKYYQTRVHFLEDQTKEIPDEDSDEVLDLTEDE